MNRWILSILVSTALLNLKFLKSAIMIITYTNNLLNVIITITIIIITIINNIIITITIIVFVVVGMQCDSTLE